MKRLSRPKSQNAAILWLFIQKPTWTRWKLEKWTGSSYPSARIRDLKHRGIEFHGHFEQDTNRFGHNFNSRVWEMVTPKKEAIKIYNQINGK